MKSKNKIVNVDEISLQDLISPKIKANWPKGFKVMAEISTSHLTANDAVNISILEMEQISWFIGSFPYGWMLRTEVDAAGMRLIRTLEMSASFFEILSKLHFHEIYYVCFDQDGPVVKEWPVFNW